MTEQGDRWIVIEQEGAEKPWVVHDRAGELGDLAQRHCRVATRMAQRRNHELSWAADAATGELGEEGEVQG